MKIIKRALLIILFFIFILVSVYEVSRAFIPNSTIAREVYTGYYKLDKNSIDVLFLGDSSVYRGISPLELYNKDGIASYNMALTGARIHTQYKMLKESLKTQKPKLLVINTESLYLTSKQNENLDKVNKQFELDLIGKLKKVFSKEDKRSIHDKLKYIFPVIEFHDNWKNMNLGNYASLFVRNNYYRKGFIPSRVIKPYKKDYSFKVIDDKRKAIPLKNKKYFNKIINLAKENNIKILVIAIPNTHIWDYQKHNEIKHLSVEKEFKFLDLVYHAKELDFSFKTDTRDGGYHLNTYGALKVSDYLSTYLKKNYQLKDIRNDDRYVSWKEDYQKYEKFIGKNRDKNLVNKKNK